MSPEVPPNPANPAGPNRVQPPTPGAGMRAPERLSTRTLESAADRLAGLADNLAERRTPSELGTDIASAVGAKVLAARDQVGYATSMSKEIFNQNKEPVRAYLSEKKQTAQTHVATRLADRSADRRQRKADTQREKDNFKAAAKAAAQARKLHRRERKIARQTRRAERRVAHADLGRVETIRTVLSEKKQSFLGHLATKEAARKQSAIQLGELKEQARIAYEEAASLREEHKIARHDRRTERRIDRAPLTRSEEVKTILSEKKRAFLGRIARGAAEVQENKASIKDAKEQAKDVADAAARARQARRQATNQRREDKRRTKKLTTARARQARRDTNQEGRDRVRDKHLEAVKTRKDTALQRKNQRLTERKAAKAAKRTERYAKKHDEYAEKLARQAREHQEP